MRDLQQARQRAQICRERIGPDPKTLLKRVALYLLETYGIELTRATSAFLEGGRAEISPAEGCLFYDAQLDQSPDEKQLVILHELGHLELHPRLQRGCATPDPVYGTMYLNDGAPALARYNRRSREEAEANAFAMEFLCPSRDLLHMWRRQPHTRLTQIAQRLGAPVAIVQTQLAEALYWHTVRTSPPSPLPTGNAIDCDATQLQAAMWTGTPVLVNAGPGTGKTATLIRRVQHLLNDLGSDPEQILILTFSNDAAEELRDRIASHCGSATAARIDVRTFHGFGVSFLHHHGQFLNISHDVTLLDESAQAELITSLLGTLHVAPLLNLANPDRSVSAIVRHLTYLKDRLITPDDFAGHLQRWKRSPETQSQHDAATALLAIYRAYEQAKQRLQRVDFADLIALPIHIFKQQPELQQAYQEKYRWIMVDEYQDVSRSVALLLRQLCGPENPPWVVGDARQAIYRFRGAAPENVHQFSQDFPGARQFHLTTNYRSSTGIVRTANQLAQLMESEALNAPVETAPWRCGAAIAPHSMPAVTIAAAPSDAAEHAGIAQQIDDWLQQGIQPQDIAVLARRNMDVRKIVLTLGARQLQATATGMITPEGAAGDLAAVVTLTDQPRASLPRLAFALGRHQYPTSTINRVIRHLLSPSPTASLSDDPACGELLTAIKQVRTRLQAEHFRSDAFAMMCTFLFDSSDYLRHLLDQPAGATQSLALGEIITALSRAASYRFLHLDAEPTVSRRGFAQVFRAALNSRSPALLPPQHAPQAIRVMTCHASKGLEFPYVILAGQTLPPTPRAYTWLPPSLTPSGQDERDQADALFFVGVTRAQHALAITYAIQASGAKSSRTRQLTPLLERWQSATAMIPQRLAHVSSHLDQPMAQPSPHAMDAIWGGSLKGALPSRAFAPQMCQIRTYLEQYLGLYFPQPVRPLYPIFFDVIRRAMGRIVRLTQSRGTSFSQAEAKELFLREWPIGDLMEHPHQALYAQLACEAIENFARAYAPAPQARQHLDLTVRDDTTGLLLHYDVLALYDAEDKSTIAITLRPESLHTKHRDQGLLWSGISPAHRMSFALLKATQPCLKPYVFSAADSTIYPYQWTRNDSEWEREAERLNQQKRAFAQGQFRAPAREWDCNRCPLRISCPHFLMRNSEFGIRNEDEDNKLKTKT